MAVGRPTADGLADELGGLYRALEQELAAGIAKRLAAGLDAEDWQTKKLAAAGEVRRWITNTVRRVAGKNGKLARAALSVAFERGAGEAQRELAGRRGGNIAGVQRDLPGAHAIDRLAGALTGRLDGAHLQIARSAADAYQRVVAAPSALALGGALTRRQAAERVWNGLLDQGFTGFVDKAGRKWTAAGYAEMATRTATAQAAVQGHLDRMAELGIDLVIVSDAAQECRLCRPWEGKILSRTGPGGPRTVEVESELTGELIKVHVAGSLAEAIREGLMHPNCRHGVSAYLPGVTKPIKDTADPQGDAARQHLRYLEREQRRWRLREAGALNPADKAKAAAKVKERQAQIRAHVKANDLTRRPDREQLDLGNKRSIENATNRTVRPTFEPPAPRVPTPEERLRATVDSGVESVRQLGGGVMAKTDLITAKNGERYVRKRALGYTGQTPAFEQDGEELGALVVRALGGRAPRVIRLSDDTVAMEYVEGDVMDALTDAERAALARTPEARRTALADFLMGNMDRNGGNVIRGVDGKPVGIDHGGAFDFHPEHNPADKLHIRRQNQFAERLQAIHENFLAGQGGDDQAEEDQLTLEDVQLMQDQLGNLADEFERLDRKPWFNLMSKRLRVLATLARRKE